MFVSDLLLFFSLMFVSNLLLFFSLMFVSDLLLFFSLMFVSGLLLFFTPVAQIFCCALQYYWSKFLLFFALHNVNLRFPVVLCSNSSCSFFYRQEFYLPRSTYFSKNTILRLKFRLPLGSNRFFLLSIWLFLSRQRLERSAWRFCKTFSFSLAFLQNFFVQHGDVAKLFRSAWRFCKTFSFSMAFLQNFALV